jgi:hypothetical protein
MKLLSLAMIFAAGIVATGCASAPPPPAAPPPAKPDWVTAAAANGNEGDFQFTPIDSSKEKLAGAHVTPPTTLKMDGASGDDVKHTHLKAAENKEELKLRHDLQPSTVP